MAQRTLAAKNWNRPAIVCAKLIQTLRSNCMIADSQAKTRPILSRVTTSLSTAQIISRRAICRTTFAFGRKSRMSTVQFSGSTDKPQCLRPIWAGRVIVVCSRNRRPRGAFRIARRQAFEYEIEHIENSKLIPLAELAARLDELDRTEETVAVCHTSARSAHAVQLLQRAGFRQASNLKGGISAWANEIDPTMPKY